MVNKYVKNASGYCYKVCGDKKTRISNEEYQKKTKKRVGGVFGRAATSQGLMNHSIHYTNLPNGLPVQNCERACKNQTTPNRKPYFNCVVECINGNRHM